jgi:hypothetical protein
MVAGLCHVQRRGFGRVHLQEEDVTEMVQKASIAAAMTLLAIHATGAQSNPCNINSTAGGSLSCTVPTTITVSLPSLLRLTLSGFTSGTNTALDVPTLDDYDATTGLATKTTVGPSFVVKANRSYKVQISASAATFTQTPPSGGGTYAKPVNDVEWTINGSAFTHLTTTATDLTTLQSAIANSSSVQVSYRTGYDFSKDRPGDYSLGITYTLVAP